MKLNARAILGLLLWSQSLFLASTFRSWFVIVMLSVLATLLVTLREWLGGRDQESPTTFPRWLRWTIFFLLFAVTACCVTVWRVGSQIDEEINPIYLGVDIVAHWAMVAGLIVWVIRPWHGHLAMLPLGLVVVLLSVAAGGASVSLAAQTTVALASCLGFTIGSQVILGSQQKVRVTSLDREHHSERSPWLAPIFSLLTLSLLMMGTSAIANATNYVLPTLQNRLREQLKASLDAVGEQTVIGGTRYVNGGRIGSIRRHILGNPREIALKIYCEVPPGYLRGNVFDLYRGGRWMDSGSAEFSRLSSLSGVRDHSILPAGAGSTVLQRDISQSLQRFPLVSRSSAHSMQLEIHNDPMKGPMVFLPLTTQWIEARSREIAVTSHGIVRLGVDVTRPYVAGVGATLPSDELSAASSDIVMDVSPSLVPVLQSTAQSVCGSSTTAHAKATAISKYFQKEYAYSLTGVDTPRGVDPLTHFLGTQHPAHCEFFASATALMLRTVGVPTRYVTGYVADEASEEQSGLWLARNQDAHAWVEAYDNQTGRWFPVESTPGRSYLTVEPDQQDTVTDSVFFGFLDQGDDEHVTVLGRIYGWFASMRASDPLLLLLRVTQLPLFFVLVFVLWSRYVKPSRNSGDSTDAQCRRMLRQADRRVRRFALVRRSSETLYQFADRIEQVALDGSHPKRNDAATRLEHSADWYRAYADARYQGLLPQPLE